MRTITLGTCDICGSNSSYSIILEMLLPLKKSRISLPRPCYQAICYRCGCNGVLDRDCVWTNNQIRNTIDEYLRKRNLHE